jgi:hypothetical protein
MRMFVKHKLYSKYCYLFKIVRIRACCAPVLRMLQPSGNRTVVLCLVLPQLRTRHLDARSKL